MQTCLVSTLSFQHCHLNQDILFSAYFFNLPPNSHHTHRNLVIVCYMVVFMLYDAFNATAMTLCLVRGELGVVYTPDHQNRGLKRKGGKNPSVFIPSDDNKERNKKSVLTGIRKQNQKQFAFYSKYQLLIWHMEKRRKCNQNILRSNNSPALILPIPTFSKGFLFLLTSPALLII